MEALNLLAGEASVCTEVGEMNGFSSAIYQRVRDMHAVTPPPVGLIPEEAASELLGTTAMGYHHPDEFSTTVPFALDRVAWPDRGHRGLHLGHHLESSLRDRFEGMQVDWVRPPSEARRLIAEEKAPRPFMDDSLRKDRSKYKSFVREGLWRGLLDVKRHIKERIGFSVCAKKTAHSG